MNPPLKLPVSVCIIAGNEAHRIGDTLKSVQGWTSEIVVVINEDVSDGTDKVVEAFGGKVFREPWRFLRAYFFRLGFLDGWQGFYIAKLSAFSTLTRYIMVREAEQEQAQPPAARK